MCNEATNDSEQCPSDDKKTKRTCKLLFQRPSTEVYWVPAGKTQCTWECKKDSFGITKITRMVDGDSCPQVPDDELAPGNHGF